MKKHLKVDRLPRGSTLAATDGDDCEQVCGKLRAPPALRDWQLLLFLQAGSAMITHKSAMQSDDGRGRHQQVRQTLLDLPG
jgi:hypothetical protein